MGGRHKWDDRRFSSILYKHWVTKSWVPGIYSLYIKTAKGCAVVVRWPLWRKSLRVAAPPRHADMALSLWCFGYTRRLCFLRNSFFSGSELPGIQQLCFVHTYPPRPHAERRVGHRERDRDPATVWRLPLNSNAHSPSIMGISALACKKTYIRWEYARPQRCHSLMNPVVAFNAAVCLPSHSLLAREWQSQNGK